MLEGKPQRIDATETLRAINSILTDSKGQGRRVKQHRDEQRHPQDAAPMRLTLTPVREVEVKPLYSKYSAMWDGSVPRAPAEIVCDVPQGGVVPTQTSPALRRVKALRAVALVVLLVCAVWQPTLAVLPLFVGLAAVFLAFIALGRDRFWRVMRWILARFATRKPEKVADVRNGLEGFATRWNTALGRLLGRCVGAFYWPDLSNPALSVRKEDQLLMDRLARMHHQV